MNYKKIILGALIILLIAGFNYIFYPKIKDYLFKNEDYLNKHITLVKENDIYKVKMPKGVDVFTETYQKIINKKIKKLFKENNYTFEKPLIILNPYGTNNTGINIYYKKEENTSLSYTIKVKGLNDFTKTINSSKEEYQIIGLVNDKVNNIKLELIKDKKVIKTNNIKIKLKTTSKVDTILTIKKGDSKKQLTDGLYTVLGHDKSFNSNIYLYDNDGVLRAELPLKSYRSDRIIFKDNYMIYSYKNNGFIKVDSTGKIVKFYNIKGYCQHHDFVYSDNKLIILANKNNASTIEDRVISIDLNTNKTTELLNLKNYLKDFYKQAVKPKVNTYGGSELDWIHLNSLAVNGNDIFLSSRELSTIIKIKDIYNTKKLDYIITDDSMVKGTSYEKYNYTKIGTFTSQAGQHSITYTKDSNLTDGQYYLEMYNNNYASARTKPDFDWSNYKGTGTYEKGSNSMYYKYLIDENKKTYTLVKSFNVPYSSIVSNIQNVGDNIVTSSGRDNSFAEYDSDGNLIKQYNYTSKKYAYRVFKYNFDLWYK